MTAVYPSLTALANQEFLATHDTGCTTEMCTPCAAKPPSSPSCQPG